MSDNPATLVERGKRAAAAGFDGLAAQCFREAAAIHQERDRRKRHAHICAKRIAPQIEFEPLPLADVVELEIVR